MKSASLILFVLVGSFLLPCVVFAAHLAECPEETACPLRQPIMSHQGTSDNCDSNADTIRSSNVQSLTELFHGGEGALPGRDEYFNRIRNSYIGMNSRFPAESCAEIKTTFPNADSGYYWLNRGRTYCRFDYNTGNPDRDNIGWERIAYVDMTNMMQECPGDGLMLVQPPEGDARYCVRKNSAAGCDSVLFWPGTVMFSRVSGRVIGIQIGSGDIPTQGSFIDDAYLDGVSLTLSSQPRTHIWSFMSYTSEFYPECPCSNGSQNTPLDFIGDDYFCESGANTMDVPGNKAFTDDPIWDGENCRETEVGCCNISTSLQSPPWFYKELPSPASSTSEAVELRVCTDQGTHDESVGVQLIELYVQ